MGYSTLLILATHALFRHLKAFFLNISDQDRMSNIMPCGYDELGIALLLAFIANLALAANSN